MNLHNEFTVQINYIVFPTLVIALGLFLAGRHLASYIHCGVTFYVFSIGSLVIAIPGLVFAVYYLKVFNELIWLYRLRSIPFSELLAGGSGFFAGLLYGRFSKNVKFRKIAGRWFFPGILLLGLVVPYLKPVLRPLRWNEFQDKWVDGICLQSSESSCGPACVVTLLHHLGKATTETEIARECFTSRGGTENWYLARAIRNRGFKVKFVSESNPSSWPFPAIAGVRLRDFQNAGHFITVLGRQGDKFVIGDPLQGKLVMSESSLRENYDFTGFFMSVK